MQAIHAGVPWCEDEIEHLRKHYGVMPTADLAADLGRTVPSVRQKAQNCGLADRQRGHKMTAAAAKRHGRKLAEAYGCRNWGDYMNQRRRVEAGWKYPGCRTELEAKVCQVIKSSASGMTVTEVAAACGRSASWIGGVMSRLAKDWLLVRKRVHGKYVYQAAVRRDGWKGGTRYLKKDVG